MSPMIDIAGRRVGPGHVPFIIAEVAQAHDGSLGAAHAYIDAVAGAGVDAIKFQTHIAAAESTLDEPFRVKFSRQDSTRYEYWQRMEFTAEQWAGLAAHAADCGIVFLSSAFSVAAVDLLKRVGMPAWKVGSGEVRSRELMDAMATAGGPILLSSGMSSYAEIGDAVSMLRERNATVALFQCTSQYPVALEAVGLNVIDELRRRFDCPVGLSDHSGTPFPALAAMATGADMIEAHVVFDKRMHGPDTPASLTVEEFGLLVRARDAFAAMHSNPVDKDAVAAAAAPMRAMFGKSVATLADLEAGTILTADLLTMKKPGTGIPAGDLGKVLGLRLTRRVEARRLLTWEDIDA